MPLCGSAKVALRAAAGRELPYRNNLHIVRAERTATFCPLSDNSGQLMALDDGETGYRGGCVVGFHSRASVCASATCAGLMRDAMRSHPAARLDR
jgi:hypothetical protein